MLTKISLSAKIVLNIDDVWLVSCSFMLSTNLLSFVFYLSSSMNPLNVGSSWFYFLPLHFNYSCCIF